MNPRFARKVLFNHERTQRKLDSCSLKASTVWTQSGEVVNGVKKITNEWNEALDHFQKTVDERYEQ